LAVVEIDGEWGYIDKTGEIVIDVQFDRAGNFSEGLAWVIIDEQLGYIDQAGNVVIEPQFDAHPRPQSFSEGLAAVQVGKWGYIDRTGEMVIEPQFDSAHDFHGLAQVEIGDKWGYIDEAGEYVWQPTR
jgi:hypothetical protein